MLLSCSPDHRPVTKPQLHGLLIIDKPAHWTSHDVVGWARKWAGERKIGHAGTLDPAATGVLPLAINDGTKILEYLSDADKAYRAEITFGIATDSADIEGTVIATDHTVIDRADFDRVLDQFRGPISQIPPAHSAIRIDGKRAYELARAGQEVEMPSRDVTIHDLTLISFESNVAVVDIACSKGTYIRSLARDLGAALGTVAYLSNLVRTRSGPFDQADAWTIAELRELDPVASWPELAMHPDEALIDWPAIVLSDAEETDWRFGRAIAAPGEPGMRARMYNTIGEWVGLAEYNPDANNWQPTRVIGNQ